MRNQHLLGAAAALALFLAPAAAWSQGNAADTAAAASNSANAAPTTAPANAVMGNSAAAAAAPAAPDAGASDAGNPTPVMYKVDRGFPWGILGVIGLIGLLPLFRRRDS